LFFISLKITIIKTVNILKKESNIHSFDKKKFDQFLERKKHQLRENQYLEAGALISEIKTVDTDEAYLILKNRINRSNKVRQFYIYVNKIAGILILPLLILTVWNLTRENQYNTENQLSYHEISSPPGVRSKALLPDGTEVWLNTDSKIRYSIPFVRKTREIELIGEAFLDVTENTNSPLEIKFDDVTVRVLGTQFNVKAFPEDQRMEVVLKKGSIQLKNDNEGSNKETILLNPDQQWIYDKTTHSSALNEVKADRFIAWHKNILILADTPMAEMAKQIERWYDVDIEILDKELYKYRFTTVFENESLHRILELLEMSSPIKINYIPGKINESGENPKSIIQIGIKK